MKMKIFVLAAFLLAASLASAEISNFSIIQKENTVEIKADVKTEFVIQIVELYQKCNGEYSLLDGKYPLVQNLKEYSYSYFQKIDFSEQKTCDYKLFVMDVEGNKQELVKEFTINERLMQAGEKRLEEEIRKGIQAETNIIIAFLVILLTIVLIAFKIRKKRP